MPTYHAGHAISGGLDDSDSDDEIAKITDSDDESPRYFRDENSRKGVFPSTAGGSRKPVSELSSNEESVPPEPEDFRSAPREERVPAQAQARGQPAQETANQRSRYIPSDSDFDSDDIDIDVNDTDSDFSIERLTR